MSKGEPTVEPLKGTLEGFEREPSLLPKLSHGYNPRVDNRFVPWMPGVGPQKSTQAKIRIGISHINPLIMKPNKVGISR